VEFYLGEMIRRVRFIVTTFRDGQRRRGAVLHEAGERQSGTSAVCGGRLHCQANRELVADESATTAGEASRYYSLVQRKDI
jgi:hypothetical protein